MKGAVLVGGPDGRDGVAGGFEAGAGVASEGVGGFGGEGGIEVVAGRRPAQPTMTRTEKIETAKQKDRGFINSQTPVCYRRPEQILN